MIQFNLGDNHGQQKLETDNKVGGARDCLQTMGAPSNFIVRTECSAAHGNNFKGSGSHLQSQNVKLDKNNGM